MNYALNKRKIQLQRAMTIPTRVKLLIITRDQKYIIVRMFMDLHHTHGSEVVFYQ